MNDFQIGLSDLFSGVNKVELQVVNAAGNSIAEKEFDIDPGLVQKIHQAEESGEFPVLKREAFLEQVAGIQAVLKEGKVDLDFEIIKPVLEHIDKLIKFINKKADFASNDGGEIIKRDDLPVTNLGHGTRFKYNRQQALVEGGKQGANYVTNTAFANGPSWYDSYANAFITAKKASGEIRNINLQAGSAVSGPAAPGCEFTTIRVSKKDPATLVFRTRYDSGNGMPNPGFEST